MPPFDLLDGDDTTTSTRPNHKNLLPKYWPGSYWMVSPTCILPDNPEMVTRRQVYVNLVNHRTILWERHKFCNRKVLPYKSLAFFISGNNHEGKLCQVSFTNLCDSVNHDHLEHRPSALEVMGKATARISRFPWGRAFSLMVRGYTTSPPTYQLVFSMVSHLGPNAFLCSSTI